MAKKDEKSFLFVRIFSMIGFSLSAYLLWLKLSGQISSIAGCGAGSGCANVLGSQWSQVFNVPVSALSTALYAILFGLTFNPQRFILNTLAAVLVASAIWFVGVQVLQIHAFCPWCTGVHVVGVLCAFAILISLSPHRSGSLTDSTALGAALVGILILGQIFGPRPDTHLLTDELADSNPTVVGSAKTNEGQKEQVPVEPAAPDEATEIANEQANEQATEPVAVTEGEPGELTEPIHSRGTGRVVKFGDRSFNVETMPRIGSADAPHVIVEYFDYTCGSCRDMYGDLKKLRAKYGDEVAVLMLPVPLNRKCNPELNFKVEDHEHACELARIALAAWRVSPDDFPKIHDLLFSRPVLEPHAAQSRVGQLVGVVELQKALLDPWIEQVIDANIADFQTYTTKTIRMPKLLIRDTRMLHGLAKNSQQFVEIVAAELNLPVK